MLNQKEAPRERPAGISGLRLSRLLIMIICIGVLSSLSLSVCSSLEAPRERPAAAGALPGPRAAGGEPPGRGPEPLLIQL